MIFFCLVFLLTQFNSMKSILLFCGPTYLAIICCNPTMKILIIMITISCVFFRIVGGDMLPIQQQGYTQHGYAHYECAINVNTREMNQKVRQVHRQLQAMENDYRLSKSYNLPELHRSVTDLDNEATNRNLERKKINCRSRRWIYELTERSRTEI